MHFNYSFDWLSHLNGNLIGLAIVVFIVWLVILVSALGRKDLDPVTKFMWVFLIVTTSILGALIFYFMTPSVQPEPRPSADYTGAPSTCAACKASIPAGSSVCPKCGWAYDVAKAS